MCNLEFRIFRTRSIPFQQALSPPILKSAFKTWIFKLLSISYYKDVCLNIVCLYKLEFSQKFNLK